MLFQVRCEVFNDCDPDYMPTANQVTYIAIQLPVIADLSDDVPSRLHDREYVWSNLEPCEQIGIIGEMQSCPPYETSYLTGRNNGIPPPTRYGTGSNRNIR